jgi:hypothetical protein
LPPWKAAFGIEGVAPCLQSFADIRGQGRFLGVDGIGQPLVVQAACRDGAGQSHAVIHHIDNRLKNGGDDRRAAGDCRSP